MTSLSIPNDIDKMKNLCKKSLETLKDINADFDEIICNDNIQRFIDGAEGDIELAGFLFTFIYFYFFLEYFII